MNANISGRPSWPPSRLRILWVMFLGSILGGLEGGVIGTICGGELKITIANGGVGWLYGYVAGWGFCRLWYWLTGSSRAWLWGASVWLVGAILTGWSSVELSHLGDNDELWCPGLLIVGIPWLLLILTAVLETIWNTSTARRRMPAGIIDVLDFGTCDLVPPSGKLWLMLLLLAIKDKATELLLESTREECRLRYRISGELVDLVPPPRHLVPDLVRWLDRVAKLRTKGSLLARLRRFVPLRLFRLPREGTWPLRIGETFLSIQVSVQPSQDGWTVVTHIPEHIVEREAASALDLLTRRRRPSPPPETGISHVNQGSGTCIIATLAMIAGINYEEAGRRVPSMPFCGWFWFRRLHGALEQLTQKKWESVPLDSLPRRLGRIPFPDWPVVAVIGDSQVSRLHHCIVVKANFIHDPSLIHAVPIGRYNRRDWRVLSIFRPLGQALEGDGQNA